MMMMQSEHLIQTSWPIQSYFHSDSDYYESEHHEILSSINSTPENSMISSGLYGCEEYPLLGYDQMQNPSPVYSESQNINTLDDVCRWLCDDDNQEVEEIQSVVTVDDAMEELNSVMEPEPQTGLENLLKAYADGMSMGQTELAKVIVKCISEKINPVGQTLERIAFSLFVENQEEYLKQESMRNFKIAFRVFYDIFPYGRFAHFTANSTILEVVPTHVESVHIVDFDLCEGSQWPQVIQAIAQMKKSLIITSIKLDQDQDQDSQFDQTRRHLYHFARSFGLNLKVQEMGMSELVSKMDERHPGSEFMVFNCMVSLPHMRKTRKTHQVNDFLKVAKFILTENQGIITFGDGEERERTRNHSDFPSFFNKNLAHYKALYESIESGFPSYLNEARIAMETLFLSPFVSSKSWFQKWQEQGDFRNVLGLKGVKMSRESWDEARELVKEGETPYGIRIEGENGNEMVLEWSGIPLVKVSAWV